MTGRKAHYDGIVAFSQTDFWSPPVLAIHPIGAEVNRPRSQSRVARSAVTQ